MSVVGFDIGNFKSSVGVARAGGIEIVANEYSDRITPTYVAFTNNERFQGHSAKQQEVTNHRNTMSNFKRLLGRKFNDPQVQNEHNSYGPLRISASADERVIFNADYLNETRDFTSEQIMAMFMTKLRQIGEMNLNTKVVDCVISVPAFMTDTERRALVDASQVAGLNCLKLMNETTAVALNYGLYHPSLPETNEKPHVCVFVDMGYSQITASAVAFNKGKLRVLATTFDNCLGGRDFDKVLCDHFQADFKQRYGVDAYTNARAKIRLRTECEKLKKLMSSNSSLIPINIECFMNDIDVQGKMKREDFEKLAEPLLARVKRTLHELLAVSKLTLQDIDLIEIVGGSTRIPAVKQIVQEVFGKEASTTLNADEACARGCTIMCAILSPTFKVKEFKIEECQLFPITLNWKAAETDDNELEVFPYLERIPLSKLLTIYKREPFEIEARYKYPNNIPFNEPRIGKFFVGNVTPNANGENSEIKIKARITKNGIFEISSPQLIEAVEASNDEQKANGAPQQATAEHAPPTPGDSQSNSASQDTESNAVNGQDSTQGEANAGEEQSEQQQQQQQQQQHAKKRKTRTVDLPLTAKVPQLGKNEINAFLEQELSMIMEDKKERERAEAKNSVEEYIYEIRDKLANEYERFIFEENKSTFLRLLDDTESWLYSEDAENQEKNVYVDRLQSLKNYGEPLKKRFRESQDRPAAFEELGRSIQLVKKALAQFYQGDEKYDHLDKAEVDKVAKNVEEKQRWFEEKSNLVNKMKLFEDPVVLVSQIRAEKESLDRSAWGVLNKPKPKVEPPKQAEPPKGQQQQQQPQNANTASPQGPNEQQKEMDVD